MSTLNVSNFEFELIKKIRNTIDDKELAILHKALNVLKTGAIFTVIQFSDLPDASENVGKLYFVKNDSILYFSFISSYRETEIWIPITNMTLNTLWSWGCNNGSQLGDGSNNTRFSPVSVVGNITTWIDISTLKQTAASSSIGLKSDGTIWTWGTNGSGQLGDGTAANRCSPGTIAGGGTNWCQIAGGNSHFSAIKTDGTLWTWGSNSCGTLGEGTTVSRCSPGTIFGGGTTWCQVSGGFNATGAIKTDGTLWTWGCNASGQLGDGTTVSRSSPGTIFGGGTNWCQVSFGRGFGTSIKTDGTLWTWGDNTCGALGDGTTVSRCSPGTIWGSATNWCQVSGGYNHSSAIKTDGTLWTWGFNGQGRLGDGTATNRCSPGTVAGGGTNWCQVSGGIGATGAIKTDGTLWTWGCNNISGQLGDGTTTNKCSPGTIFGGGTTWSKLSFGGNFVLAISIETL